MNLKLSLFIILLFVPVYAYADGSMWDGVLNYFDMIKEFITDGIFELLTSFIAFLVSKLTILYFKIMIFLTSVFWESSKLILENLNISGQINSLWGELNSDVLAYFTALRIPEAINMVLNAIVTRFSLSMWGLK